MTALESATRSHVILTLVAPAGLALNVLCQLIISRLPVSLGHVRRQFVSFGLGLVFTAIAAFGLLSCQRPPAIDFAGYLGLELVSYVFMGFCFFHVINLNISSLRIRMLKEYFRQDPLPLTPETLLLRYNVGAMLDARLERLQSGNQVYTSQGRYLSRPGGVVAVGRIFSLLRWILLPH
jgi:hypothetical protein